MMKIYQGIREGFNIVPPAEFKPTVAVERRESRSSYESSVVVHGDVDPRSWITVLLCEPEVDDECIVPVLGAAHENVLRLDVAVNDIAGMDVFKDRKLGRGNRTGQND